jgi:hypothetical protein
MTLQMAEIRKIYSQNQSNSKDFFLNPFTETLFLNNWLWPQDCFASKKYPLKKNHLGGDSLKEKIKQW